MKTFFTSIIVSIIIAFLAGSFFGYSLFNQDIDETASLLRQSELNTESFVLEQELITALNSDQCDLGEQRIKQQSEELYRIGKRLDTENAMQQLGERNYHFLKQKFHLLQIRTYTLYKTLHETCDFDEHVVLFYFKQDDPASAQQGAILDELVIQYPLIVFAMEYDYSKELTFLQQYYDLTDAPALIIDFDHVFQGKQDRHSLTSYLEHDTTKTST